MKIDFQKRTFLAPFLDGQTVECTHLDPTGYLQKAGPIQLAIPSKRVVCSLFSNFYSISNSSGQLKA